MKSQWIGAAIVAILAVSQAVTQDLQYYRKSRAWALSLNPNLAITYFNETQGPGLAEAWVVYTDDTFSSTSLPMNHVGDVERLTPTRWLVSGLRDDMTPAEGVLCVIDISGQPTANAVTIVETRTLPGVDPIDVVRSEIDGNLYLRDYGRRRVLAISWRPDEALASAAPPVLVADWTTVDLRHPQSMTLESPELRHAVAETLHPGFDPELNKGFRLQYAPSRFGRVFAGASGWDYDPYDYEAFFSPVKFFDIDCQLPGGERGFRMFSEPNSGSLTWTLGDIEAGVVVATGSLSASGVTDSGPMNAFQMDPGGFYNMAVPGRPDLYVRGCVRYGLPGGNLPGLSLGRVLTASRYGPFVGDNMFGVFSPIDLDASTSDLRGEPATATLWAALRRPDGTDPVVLSGDIAVLQADAQLDVQLTGARWPEDIGLHVVPQNDLAGEILLVQWVVTTSAGVEFSDVFGTRIDPTRPAVFFPGTVGALATPSSAAASGEESAPARSSVPVWSDRLRALRHLVSGDGAPLRRETLQRGSSIRQQVLNSND
jgi:hypothetical protein